MIARRLGTVVAVATLVASGTYVFVYLYRWEWNRALIAGVFLLAAEVALAAGAVLGRLRALEATRSPAGPAVLQRVREAAPPARDHFAWLQDPTRGTAVFVPILMGVGVVFSALAWIVERLARATAGPALEHHLAARLRALTLPPGHLLARRPLPSDDPTLLLGPRRR